MSMPGPLGMTCRGRRWRTGRRSPAPPGGTSPKNVRTLSRAISREVRPPLVGHSRPSAPTARSSEHDSAPEPTPASITRGAGEEVGHRDDLRRVLRVDHGGAARHGQHVVGKQRAQRHVGRAARGRSPRCPRAARSGRRGQHPRWVWNVLPGRQHEPVRGGPSGRSAGPGRRARTARVVLAFTGTGSWIARGRGHARPALGQRPHRASANGGLDAGEDLLDVRCGEHPVHLRRTARSAGTRWPARGGPRRCRASPDRSAVSTMPGPSVPGQRADLHPRAALSRRGGHRVLA